MQAHEVEAGGFLHDARFVSRLAALVEDR